MTKDAITERLKFLTELLRFAFVALLAIGGGTLGLLLGPQDPLRLGFAIAGIVASLSLGIVIWILAKRMQRLLIQLEEQQP
jgi:hypothetical protein